MNLPIQTQLATAVQRANLLKLRPYQADAKAEIYQAWNAGAINVLAVLPTGAGKTVTFSDIIHDHRGPSCAIAHRQELVAQISLALARDRVRHRIIGPKSVVKLCVNQHMAELGASYYDPVAPCAVAGVDTLVRRGAELATWLQSVTLWVQDEAHHVLEENKWGTAAAMFPNARGLGVTATPLRADGKGLGRHADGVFDVMVEGPGMRDLIDMGYLTDYTIYAPPAHLLMDDDDVSQTTGDFKRGAVVKKFRNNKNRIIGDVVGHYLKHANGKLGITFVPDVQDATEMAQAFRDAGVPAEAVSAKTPDAERIAILRRFKNRELLQLVNVDLFGEGFDLPAIEVVSMARPTQSFALYVQQFGRALRLMIDSSLYPHWDNFTNEQRRAHIAASAKPRAVIIDHVGNVERMAARFGLPDYPPVWSLDRRERRSKSAPSDVIPVRSCPICTYVYERVYTACPDCGYKPIPAGRSGPEAVDGDLIELDAVALAALRAGKDDIDKDKEAYRVELASARVPLKGQLAHVKRHVEKQAAQEVLREAIAWWAAWQRAEGRPDSESYRRFYFKFGMDVLSAQALTTADALALAEKVKGALPNG